MRVYIIVFAFAIILSITFSSLATNQHMLIANAANGRNVDLFSNKIPCDGRGPNQTSGAFAPQEEVRLYTLVTYSDGPIANKLSSFVVTGPANPYQNITIAGVAATNLSGIAGFSFRIPWPDEHAEEVVFGIWHVVGTVDIAEEPTSDYMDFRVGWIVRITSIVVLNDHLNPQTSFLRRNTVFFNLTAESIACSPKTGAIVLDVQDSMSYPIMHVEINDLTFEPDDNYFQISSQIPDSARFGEATVSAAPYTDSITSGGVLYSPAIATTFQIVTRDISIQSLIPSKTTGQIGDVIIVTMTVENKGNQTESFDASIYSNHTLIQTKNVVTMPPSTQTQVVFTWETQGLPEGDYVLSGIAWPVEGEIETDDNQFTDGIVSLYDILPPSLKRDVAITLVTAQPSEVEIGDPVQIAVRVKNLGDAAESFNVTVLYDGFPMTTFYVTLLPPTAEQNLTYTWNTSSVDEGLYTIEAYIPPLPGEENITNNWYTDGTVWIRAPHPTAETHDIAIINLNASTYEAYPGDLIGITVHVANLGDFDETFNVTVHAGMLKIGDQDSLHFYAHTNRTLDFIWNTSGLSPGDYTLWAFAEHVPGEINTGNNYFVNGAVTLLSPPIPPDHYIHDVAVIAVDPEPRSVFVGEDVTIRVQVRNYGNVTETFNVTLYYESNLIQLTTVDSLAPDSSRLLTTVWNTRNVEPGTYVLSANATVLGGEADTENNLFIDGQVSIGLYFEAPLWLLLIPFLIGLALIALLLLLLLLRRRRKKQPVTEPRYVILSHPHI